MVLVLGIGKRHLKVLVLVLGIGKDNFKVLVLVLGIVNGPQKVLVLALGPDFRYWSTLFQSQKLLCTSSCHTATITAGTILPP